MRGRRALFLIGAAIATVVASAAPGPVAASSDPAPVEIDDGAAPANPLDPELLPASFGRPSPRSKAVVEGLRSDGASGFRVFNPRSVAFGAYRLQLVASGVDGDVELLRPVAVAVAAQLTAVTNITFSVDAGQVPRPTRLDRFSSDWCNVAGGRDHRCSFFDDRDEQIGVIRIGFSAGSPCGALVPSGTRQGTVGCAGPESVVTDGGTVLHLRGNVWVSPSLQDANAGIGLDVVAHEIGHALGLDHFDGRYTAIPGGTGVRQLMYPSVHGDPSDTGLVYRSGDAQGLWWLQPRDAWYITATYRDFLGRIPDTAGYHFWVTSDQSPDDYVTALATSDEWIGRIVDAFYDDVFGRDPDAGGFRFWSAAVRARGVPAVAAELYGSAEYLNRNGGTTRGFVQAMYRQLLGRDGANDPAGVAYWVSQADRVGRVTVAHAFFQSEEKRRARVHELYCTLLDRPPDPGGAAHWAGVILTQGDLVLARFLATSSEYVTNSDEFALRPASAPPAPGC